MSARATRLNVILQQLADHGTVSTADLAAELAVSLATVRRDLELLDQQRLLARSRGGAVAYNGVLYELPLRYRAERKTDVKKRIAVEAVDQLDETVASVGFTGGTTTTEVARRLADRHMTVVTNALNIAAELAVRPTLKLVVTGGVARSQSYELIGPVAEASLEGLHVDVVFVGVDGITGSALTTHHEVEARTDHRLIERAQRVVVVCDASKVGTTAFAEICPTGMVDQLITESGADPAELEAIEAAGVKVITV